MSDKDQAAGLRKWANLQRQQKDDTQKADADTPALTDEQQTLAGGEAEIASMADDDDLFDFDGAFAAPDETDSATACVASEPEAPPAQAKVRIPLVVVGLPGTSVAQANKVRERLRQWAALGREWAGDPEQWDIQVVAANAPEVATLARQYRRWALWVESDAEAFVQAFRTLRLLHDAGGPRRLLALHEPGLSRRGLLDNLHEAAQYYLDTELLVLAR